MYGAVTARRQYLHPLNRSDNVCTPDIESFGESSNGTRFHVKHTNRGQLLRSLRVVKHFVLPIGLTSWHHATTRESAAASASCMALDSNTNIDGPLCERSGFPPALFHVKQPSDHRTQDDRRRISLVESSDRESNAIRQATS